MLFTSRVRSSFSDRLASGYAHIFYITCYCHCTAPHETLNKLIKRCDLMTLWTASVSRVHLIMQKCFITAQSHVLYTDSRVVPIYGALKKLRKRNAQTLQ